MSTIDLTEATFEETVSADGIVFVDWWASWCGPCRAFAPTFEAAAVANPDITFAKINTETEQKLAAGFQIMSIPTLMIFRDGVLLFSQPGALPASGLADLIEQARAVDMVEVRRQIADSEAAQSR